MKIKPVKKVNPVRNGISNGAKIRRLWIINSKVRVKKSAQIYSRPKVKRETKKSLEEFK